MLVVAAIAAAARLTVAMLSFILNADVLVADEHTYLGVAKAVASGRGAEAYEPGYGQTLYDTTWAFSGPLAFLFHIFGATRILGQLLAAAWGTATAALTTRLALAAVPARWAVAAGAVVAMTPSQVLWSSTALRESSVWLGLALAAWGLTVTVRSRGLASAGGLLVASGGLLAVGFLRDQIMLAAVWSFALAALLLAIQRRRILLVPVGLLVALTIPLLSGAGPAGWDLVANAGPKLGATRTGLALGADSAFRPTQPLSTRPATPPSAATPPPSAATTASRPPAPSASRQADVVYGARGEAYAVDNSVRGNLSSLPAGVVAVLLRPFPWEGTGGAFAHVEDLGWYLLYAFAGLGIWCGRRRLDVTAFPILVSGAVLAVEALTEGNLGTAFRHRGQMLWALALLAAIGAHALFVGTRHPRDPAPAASDNPSDR